METTLAELFRIALTVAFIAGFAWTLSVMYRYYRTVEQPVRLARMIRRLGIDASTIGETPLMHYLPAAVLLCRHCTSKSECDAWFPRQDNAAAPPAFCANGGFLHLVSREGKRAAA